MKILCVSCDRLAEMGSYRLDAGVLVITCSRCGAQMRAVDAPAESVQAAVEGQAAAPTPRLVVLRPVGEDPAKLAAVAAASEEPFAAPEGRCPKCIAPRRPEAVTCSQCGLTFVNFVPAEVYPPAPLDALWRELLLRWDDTAAHEEARLTDNLTDGHAYKIILNAAVVAIILAGPGRYGMDAGRGWARRPFVGSFVALLVGLGGGLALWVFLNGGNPLA